MNLTMHIRMCSDWHIGTGTGRHGAIDRLIARDSDGLPYVPASTIRNLWRDAAEMLACGLDGPAGGRWSELVRQLFGSQPSSTERHVEDPDPPVSSLVTMGDAGIAPALRARLLRDRPFGTAGDPSAPSSGPAGIAWLREALTYVKPGVAIDADTGAARDDHLRFEEAAVGGMLMVAQAEIAPDVKIENADTLYWFLCGAACLIERLGGKRRRGLGACEVLLVRDPAPQGTMPELPKLSAQAATYLARAAVPTVTRPQQEQTQSGNKAGGDQGAAGVGWHQLPIAITLRSPLIVPDEIQGNVITTLDYIPGSMLLPVLTSAARRCGLKGVDKRVASAQLRVLPATIEIDKKRGLPVPLAWGKLKDAQARDVVAIKSRVRGEIREEAQAREQIKPLRQGYIAPASNDSVWFRERIETTLRTHNVINDQQQTPTEDIGGVFSYEAIASKQRFRSLVLLRGTTAEADALKAELSRGPEHVARMGRAKQVGYGQISITNGTDEPSIEKRARSALDGFLVVWLETDALLALPDLSQATTLDALADAIAHALYPDRSKGGRDLFVLPEPATKSAPETCSVGFLRTRRLQTWQTRWRLPRPSLTLVQAGSVAKLRLKNGVDITESQCLMLEREGIGERRAEGLGVVRVNDAILTATTAKTKVPSQGAESQQRPTPPPDLTRDELDLLTAITKRAWKRRIIARAEAVMSQPTMRAEHLGFARDGSSPTMSQLGALRSRLPAEEADNASDVLAWIARQKTKARDRAQRDEPDWLGQVKRIASRGSQQDHIWKIVHSDDLPGPPGGTLESMRQDMWAFAVTNTLLIAIRHHKRAGERARVAKGATGSAVEGGAK